MGKNFDQIKYIKEYNKEKYDKVLLTMPKGKKEKVKKRAGELGKSVNKYINDVVDKDMEVKE